MSIEADRVSESLSRFPARAISGDRASMSDAKSVRNRPRLPLLVSPELDGKTFSKQLEEFLENARVEVSRVAAGGVIFKEGGPGDTAFFIRSGSVDILSHGPDGNERLLQRLGVGELFGEMALLDQTRRSASAYAPDGAELFIVTRDEVTTLLRQEPQMALWMLGLFSHRLRVLTRLSSQMEQVQEVNIKILAGQAEERRRIGRDIHDGVAQSFADSILRLQFAVQLLDQNQDEARSAFEDLETSLRDGLVRIRELIQNLLPRELSRAGLVGAIDQFLDRIARTDELEVSFEHDGLEDELPAALEATLYCVVQEALNNVRRHSGASRALVYLNVEDQTLKLVINDNGCGFDPERLFSDDARHNSYGLLSMNERAKLAGGTMEIDSNHGEGTLLRFIVPVRAPGSRLAYSLDGS